MLRLFHLPQIKQGFMQKMPEGAVKSASQKDFELYPASALLPSQIRTALAFLFVLSLTESEFNMGVLRMPRAPRSCDDFTIGFGFRVEAELVLSKEEERGFARQF